MKKVNETKHLEIQDQKKLINEAQDRLKNKKSKFLFCLPEIESPSALIYEIYRHADIVEKMGYEVIMLTEKPNYNVPSYVEECLTNRKHLSMEKSKLPINPDDFMVIPETFTNVMEQTKKLPCKRIGMLQSLDYKLNALIPGTNWTNFGIKDIITTSSTLKELIQVYYGENTYNIKTFDVGIPDYFKPTTKTTKPTISLVGRNSNDITKIVKLFYTRFPHFSWVEFDLMTTNSKPPQPLRRIDFAKRLRKNFAGVWVDRIASFGTFPLECMKSGVIPIGLKPDILPDYLINKNDKGEYSFKDSVGYWTENYYDIPLMIGDAVTKFIDDSIDDKTMENLIKEGEKFSEQNTKETVEKVYQELINERIELFKNAIKNGK